MTPSRPRQPRTPTSPTPRPKRALRKGDRVRVVAGTTGEFFSVTATVVQHFRLTDAYQVKLPAGTLYTACRHWLRALPRAKPKRKPLPAHSCTDEQCPGAEEHEAMRRARAKPTRKPGAGR